MKKTNKKASESFSADSFRNVLLQLGTMQDTLKQSEAEVEIVTEEEAKIYLRGSKTAQKVVGKWAEEMFREGFYVQVPGDQEFQQKISSRLDELDVAAHFERAATFREAFGGGAVLFHVEEKGNPTWEAPLDFNTLVKFTGLATLTPKECRVVEWDIEGGVKNPRYGMPLIYEVQKQSDAHISDQTRVHYSRFAIFNGYRPANRQEQAEHLGWGDSIFTSIAETLRDFEVSSRAMANLLTKFTLLVMKVEGLAEMAAQNGEHTKKRIAQLNAGLSILKMFILDSREDVKRETVNLTGAPDLLDRLASKIAMVADLPKSILLGESETGLNNDGSSTVRFFYDRVKSKQKRIAPAINTFVKALFSCTEEFEGGGEPDDWTVVFNSLWQPTQEEQAQSYERNTNADVALIDRQVVHPEEVREALAKSTNGRLVIDSSLDKDLEDMRNQAAVDDTEEEGTTEGEPPENGITPPSPGDSPVQERVLNGGQLTALQGIVEAVAKEQIPRESGVAMIKVGFQLTQDEAEIIMGKAGNGFKPKEEPKLLAAPGVKPNAAPNKTAGGKTPAPKKAAGTAQRKAPAKPAAA
jgi:phage-related protein (TIGR01555 family)